MRAGTLRVKVEIWHNVQTGTSAYNEPVYAETLWKTTWAEMRARRGQEHVVANQIFSLTQWYFEFRYHSVEGIDTSYWLVVNGQKYDIKNIAPDFARKRSVEIEARVANIEVPS